MSVVYKTTHTSKSTIIYICMPLSNRGVCYCHTNIYNRSFNGAFMFYILLTSYGTLFDIKDIKIKFGYVININKIIDVKDLQKSLFM